LDQYRFFIRTSEDLFLPGSGWKVATRQPQEAPMMGFGETGPIVWVLGALAMVVIWGGVWWGLSALVFHWPAHERNPRGPLPHTSRDHRAARWTQPTFEPTGLGQAAAPSRPRNEPQEHPNHRQNPMSVESEDR
jgi:hypothetical protein